MQRPRIDDRLWGDVTGDTVAHVGRQVMPGVFNLDREEMLRSFRKLADVDAELACVGHGEPIKNAHIALPATAGLIP